MRARLVHLGTRAYYLDGIPHMTYCGRTVNYYDPAIRIERTLPVTATFVRGRWRKICVARMPREFRKFLVSD